MINEPIQVFKLMYVVLNKEWEKEKDKLFGLYLSEADPFLTGNDSADSSVFAGFLKCFEKYGTYDEFGYDFVLKYLAVLDPYYGDIKKYFSNISKQEYIDSSEKYSKLNDEEIIELNHWEKYYSKKSK